MLKYRIIDNEDDEIERRRDDVRNNDDDDDDEQKHVHNLVLSCGGRLFIRNKFNEYFNKVETKQQQQQQLEQLEQPDRIEQNLITKLTFPFPNRSNQYFVKKHLLSTMRPLLEQSLWYYESISEAESLAYLRGTKPGTFLLRDSANENYLLAISFQTIFGTVSIRIDFKDNMFSLVPFDAERTDEVPKFSNVISLIDFYRESRSLKIFRGSDAASGGRALRHTTSKRSSNSFWIVFNANEGRKIPLSKSNPAFLPPNNNNNNNNDGDDDDDLEISLNLEITYPLYKQVPSLKHFCRLAVNRSLARQHVEFLEPDLLNYLNNYTFTI